MSRTFLFDSLRAHLKARGVTYEHLAKGLGVSEPTIKRAFASKDCSLERMEQMCRFLHIEMADLVKTIPVRRKLIEQLTAKQETELARNKPLLMVAVCALALWTIDDMFVHLKMSRAECLVLLHRLEAIGLLQLEPNQKYRLLVARHFSWIVDGPIMRLVKTVSDDFFNHRFEAPGEVLKIINVRISPEMRVSLKARLERVVQEYADQVIADSHLPLVERPPLSICIAVRSWVPDFLRDMMRIEDGKAMQSSKTGKRQKISR